MYTYTALNNGIERRKKTVAIILLEKSIKIFQEINIVHFRLENLCFLHRHYIA